MDVTNRLLPLSCFAKHWSLSTGVRYDWSESLEGEVGSAEFDVDLGGWTAMLGVGFHF